MKIMKILKFYEISRNLMKFMIFMEILHFCESGGPKTLIFLRKYWCFCNVMICMKIHFFIENVIFSWFFTFSTFSKNFHEIALFLKKRADGAQDPPKCIVFHWFKQHSRQLAARVRKHDFPEKGKKLFPRFPWKMEWSWKWWNFQKFNDFRHVKTSSISEEISTYFTKIKVPVLFRRSSWHFSKMCRIPSLFRFWSPKASFWAQNGTSAAPAQK